MSKQNRIVTPSHDEVRAYGGENVNDEQSSGVDPKANPTGTGSEPSAQPEVNDWRDKFLRAKAELANYQKRAEKDRSDAMRYAHAELARALLPLVDDLER